jgi:predicted metal-dependent enzyme (double-stranded beta helix superfamily)
LLNQLIEKIESLDEKCSLGFEQIMKTAAIDDRWVEDQIPLGLPSDRYTRLLLHSGDDYEVVMAVWPRGIQTMVHDHGILKSQGMVLVLAGQIFNQSYCRAGDEVKAAGERQIFGKGDLIPVPLGLVHAMGHVGGVEPSVSLHFYTPVIMDVSYWDPATCKPLVVPV